MLLLSALSAAVVAQGGYYLPGRVLSAVLAGTALVIALRDRPRDLFLPLACGGLAVWAFLRAVVGGEPLSAVPTIVALGVLAAAFLAAQRTDVRQRELCAKAVIGLGALAALAGWAAVVWRVPSWSVVADGLARAGSTITYPNAAAALFAALAVVAISLPSAWHAGAACVLLTGLGATLSRAGLLALVSGLVAAGFLAGWRRTARHAAGPVLGAVVAVGALVPSFPVATPAHHLLAVGGLLAGVGLAAGLTRVDGRVQVITAATVLVVGGVALVARGNLLGDRLSLSSPDRAGATDAALHLIAANPLTGVGPGRGWFAFDRDGPRVMRYAHNEYLQVLVELGAIGLVLLGVLLYAVFRAARTRVDGPWAGAVAGVLVLAVHSGFDFLWHLPVTLLAAGLLLGLASPLPKPKETP
ncbi:O-antigen ligase family protein [Actinosynnema sp. NPDC047251]|uniref:O-antigen ligase family protein n=1 Tax=Saccharothrix espanaensis TaxID=103731 RepID=UPI00031A63AC|nr:O-antigen ligase family protein [Saccharothrix espanaensis]